MTYESGQDDFGAVCPYLGLADDADSHATYATEAHRCYRLPNPTRIATGHQESYCLGANHVSCPVYLGEGVPGAPQKGAAAAPPPAAAPPYRAPEPTQTVRGPRASEAAGAGRPRPGAERATGAPRAARRPSPGSIGPKPRAGGVSLPVATIGLFALAIVVIGLAFAINQFSGGGGNNNSVTDSFKTAQAQKTAAGNTTTTPGKTTTAAPGGSATTAGTPAANQTPGATTTKPAGNGGTYTVVSGDTCSGIATAKGVTLAALLQANNMTEDDCTKLAVGQVLKLP